MGPPVHRSACPDTVPRDEHDLCLRVRGEFREMPGMNLTISQAARLFDLEPTRCERILGALVQAGVLATNGRTFARADSGRRSA
jgi:hypothetical protein